MDETLAHQVQYSVLWLKPSIFNKKSEEFFLWFVLKLGSLSHFRRR